MSSSPIYLLESLRKEINIEHIWDLGDTKLFDVAVLPAVLLLGGKARSTKSSPGFTSIYQTREKGAAIAATPIEALKVDGAVTVSDGRSFLVKHGTLDISGTNDAVWRISSSEVDEWIETVKSNTHTTINVRNK